MRLLLTNARSLYPKIDSLVDAFSSLELNLACITETWYRGGNSVKQHIDEVEGSKGIRILHRSRDGRSGRVGGGVAVAFNLTSCNFKVRSLKHLKKHHEVICVVGNVSGVDKKLIIFVVYIPPNMKVGDVEDLKELLAVEIAAAMKTYKSAICLITGDLNHRDIGNAINEVGDFTALSTGPTRGTSTIDMIFSNVPEAHSETLVLPPLQANSGALSDHNCIYTEAYFPPEKGFKWITQWRRTRDEGRDQAFAAELRDFDWSVVRGADDVDNKVRILEEVIERLTDKHFPLARVRKRSNEAAWVTKKIRRLWKKKLRLYKKKGRSQSWWNTEHKLQQTIKEARNGFVNLLLEDGNAGRSFYDATRKLSSAAGTPQWAVTDLFPGDAPAVVCDKVLDFYSSISSAPAVPIPWVEAEGGGLETFTMEKTTDLLKKAKKTQSRVTGDPLPNLIGKFPEAFAEPVTDIFNAVNAEGRWLVNWKTEHLTIIPKVPNPSGLGECRNISCTAVFSKILEGVVLEQLRTELVPDPCQYGGKPKCGTEHMLIDIWERVLEAMEGGGSAAVLLGVDYEKAFNRMEHSVCLDRLRRLGASEGSIFLVSAFLRGRRMTISIDGFSATPVPINRGSPQGSVLGCLLYCVATQLLTHGLRDGQGLLNFFPQDDHPEGGVEFWEDDNSAVFLYVDDTTLFDSVRMSEAVRHCTTSKTTETFQQLRVAGDLNELTRRAEEIGMSINERKTQLLVVSPPNGCETTAVIATGNGGQIKSSGTLKLVGFTFGSEPGPGAHIDSIADRYSRKKWMLHHLSEAGFKGQHLFKLYCCYIRSIIEYGSPVYHSLLNGAQELRLERLQRHALRVCFGYHRPIEEAMKEFGISTLKDRRVRRCDNFIRKAEKKPRFAEAWFPQRQIIPHQLRSGRQVQETQAITNRRFKSPLAFLKRRANELGIVPASWGWDQ